MTYLVGPESNGALASLQVAACIHRIAREPHAGQKARVDGRPGDDGFRLSPLPILRRRWSEARHESRHSTKEEWELLDMNGIGVGIGFLERTEDMRAARHGVSR
jgi:hypothetical protein